MNADVDAEKVDAGRGANEKGTPRPTDKKHSNHLPIPVFGCLSAKQRKGKKTSPQPHPQRDINIEWMVNTLASRTIRSSTRAHNTNTIWKWVTALLVVSQ